MEQVTMDIAKSVFQVHGVDATGKSVLRRRPHMAMNRRYWLSPGTESIVRITAHLSSAEPRTRGRGRFRETRRF